MKILHLICTDGISGAEKHIQYLLPGLVSHGFKCHLVVICPPKSKEVLSQYCFELEQKGVSTYLLSTEKPLSFGNIKRVNTYLKLHNIKNIHSHLFRSDLLAALLKQFFNSRLYLISTRHGYQEDILTSYTPENFVVRKNLYYYITKYFLRHIDKNISISHCISQLFINFKLTKENYPVIYHGVEVAFDSSAPVNDFDFTKPSIVIVGRLEPYKGHRYVIEALKVALQKLPDIQLYLLGEGSGKKDLQILANGAGVSKNVHFLGFRHNALSYINAADLIIIPSLFEPFGLVFIEALGLGKCIIAFDVPAGNEILTADSARLVEKGNVDEMAAQILYYLTNPQAKHEIEKNAHDLFLKKFTTEKMNAETASFYAGLKMD